jgi:hypothetical protein
MKNGETKKKSDEFRRHAENCNELAHDTTDAVAKRRYTRMAEAWESIAHTQAWLDGEKKRAGDAA